MARQEQSVGYGIRPVLPLTVDRLLRIVGTGLGDASATESVYGQANGQRIFIGNSAQATADEAVAIGYFAEAGGFASTCVGAGSGTTGAGVDRATVIGRSARAWSADMVCIGYLANPGWTSYGSILIGANTGQDGPGDRCIVIGQGCRSRGTRTISIGSMAAPQANVDYVIRIGDAIQGGGTNGILIGRSITGGAFQGGIGIGHGANPAANYEMVLGGAGAFDGIDLIRVNTESANRPVSHQRNSDGWQIVDPAGVAEFRVDASAVADDIRALVYDVTAAVLKRISRGAIDSAGVGFRQLRIPN